MREGEREREEGDREREREGVCEGWPAEAEGERYENAGGEPAMCGVGDKTLHPTAVDRPRHRTVAISLYLCNTLYPYFMLCTLRNLKCIRFLDRTLQSSNQLGPLKYALGHLHSIMHSKNTLYEKHGHLCSSLTTSHDALIPHNPSTSCIIYYFQTTMG